MPDRIILEDTRSIIESVGSGFSELSGKTLLVTGANGFVPSYFVDTVLLLNTGLLKQNPVKLVILTHHEITRESRLGHCLSNPAIKFIVGDLLEARLPGNIDILIHGASKASPKEYLNRSIETADINVLGTKKLLEYCVKRKQTRLLFLSSSETYGDATVVPTPETYTGNVDPLGPRSSYQESKRFAETLCSLYYRAHGIHAVIARLFHTYGPRLSLTDGRVIPEFIRLALKEETMHLTGGTSIRTFAYISDAIEAMWRILIFGEPGQAYNVGSEEETNIADLAKLIIKISGSKSRTKTMPAEHIPHTIATPDRVTPDIRKIKNLGHNNRVPLEHGLRRLVDWYKTTKAP